MDSRKSNMLWRRDSGYVLRPRDGDLDTAGEVGEAVGTGGSSVPKLLASTVPKVVGNVEIEVFGGVCFIDLLWVGDRLNFIISLCDVQVVVI